MAKSGDLLPVVDLMRRFRDVERTPDLTEQIVVCVSSGRRIGLVVPAVDTVEEMDLTRFRNECA